MTCPRCLKEVPDGSQWCCWCGRQLARPKLSRVHQRGNGTGTAYKRGKYWTGAIVVGWKPRGESMPPTPIRRKKGGFKTKNDALAWCVSDLARINGTAEAPTLAHYWNLYEKGEMTKLSKSKQAAYSIAWNKMKSIANRRVDTLTVQDLRGVVSSAASAYYPARDMKVLLSHLFNLAGADRWVDKGLPTYIILPELHEKERTPFSEVEQAALWKLYESGDRNAAIPLIMIYTGMMPGEIQTLRPEHIDFESRRIRGVGIKTKVRKESPIYLPDVIIPVLYDEVQRAEGGGLVWQKSTDRFYKDFYAALEAAGCRRLEPYCCRHTTATALAITEGIAPQTVRKVMRWSSTKMLDRYAHPDEPDAAEAVNRIGKDVARQVY